MMKELLKDIVKRITQNLLGKSMIESSPERLASDNSHSVCICSLLPSFILYAFH
jgi:hypothetical protein